MYNNNLCLWLLILIVICLVLWYVFQPKVIIVDPVIIDNMEHETVEEIEEDVEEDY